MDRITNQNYDRLKRECFRTQKKFVDPVFPPQRQSLTCREGNVFGNNIDMNKIQWKRPHEIVDDPRFIVGGTSRSDCHQGIVGDCWVVSAIACLSIHPSLVDLVVPPGQTFQHDEYSGIFHFKLWRGGRHVDIVVDDLLPVYEGKLLFMRSETENEFWSALLEKAYAKLLGAYDALQDSDLAAIYTDLTGGLCETVALQNTATVADSLFLELHSSFKRLSLVGASIVEEAHMKNLEHSEEVLKNGLITNHAYSITGIAKFVLQDDQSTVRLVRLRNPGSTKVEWNGVWSDLSHEWDRTSEEQRKNFLKIDADGEFWMPVEDVVSNFTHVCFCNLNPHLMGTDSEPQGLITDVTGAWQKGLTAGGRRKFETYASNPQYLLEVKEPDEYSSPDEHGDKHAQILITLAQKDRKRLTYTMNVSEICIGFRVYEAMDYDYPLPKEYFDEFDTVVDKVPYMEGKECFQRCRLRPGLYVIVVSTFDPDVEGEFLLRIFSEKPCVVSDGSKKVVDLNQRPIVNLHHDEESAWQRYFQRVAESDMSLECYEFQIALNSALKEEGYHFSLDTCRTIIACVGSPGTGKMDFDEFIEFWKELRMSVNSFKRYDKDKSKSISSIEIRGVLAQAGLNVNFRVLGCLFKRYADKQGCLTFEYYLLCRIKLLALRSIFEQNVNKKRELRLDEQAFIELGMSL